MEVVWHPKDSKHWNTDQDVWLCFKRFRSSSAAGIVLHEGSHHYFTEMHITRPGRGPLSKRLDGPGPFELAFDGLGDCCVLVRARFLQYTRDPRLGADGGGPDSVHAEFCAEILNADGNEPVMMQVTGNRALLNATQRAFGLDEILKVVTATATSQIKLIASATTPYYRLTEASDLPTRVFHLSATEVDPRIVPGKPLGLALDTLSSCPCTTIPAGQPAPIALGGPVLPKPAVVLPVRAVKDEHIAGPPLALRPLIQNFEIKKRAPFVTASWEWCGPRNWVRVKLAWRAYDNEGNWASAEKQEIDVSYADFAQRNNIALLRIKDYWEWNVQITATPYLVHDRPDPDAPPPPAFSTNLSL